MSPKRVCVTISVWNDFWSPHLVSGLSAAGYTVIHQTTGRKKACCTRFIRNLPATALNHFARRGLLPVRAAHRYSRKLIDKSSSKLATRSDVFWGWSGCSLAGLMQARKQGKLAILERGSTHCLWNHEILGHVYRTLGLSLAELPSDHELAYELMEYNAADIICVPSLFVFNTFVAKGISKEKLCLNPYGVDFTFWSQPQPPRCQSNEFTFLWVATLMPRKGIAVLLEAWNKARLRGAKLVVIGSVAKSVRPLLSHLPHGVELKNHLDHEGIRREMSGAHAYILPSYEEGLARSVLEAAAAGLPVIITKETGATDILKDGRDAWVVPSGDADTLADVLAQVADDRQNAAQRGTSAQQSVKSFTWDSYGQRAANLLRGLL